MLRHAADGDNVHGQGEVTKKLDEARKERDFLKDLNASLLRNQADLQKGLAAAEAQVKSISAEKQATVSDLQEQVHFSASFRGFATLKWPVINFSSDVHHTVLTRHVRVRNDSSQMCALSYMIHASMYM